MRIPVHLIKGVLHEIVVEDALKRGIDIDEYEFLFIKWIERDHGQDINVAYWGRFSYSPEIRKT